MSDEQLQSLFAGMERRMDERFDALGARLVVRIDAFGNRLPAGLRARLEALEANLLAAFHNWASPTEARLRGSAVTLQALDLELELLKERV